MKADIEMKMNCVIVIESLNNPNSTKKLYREEIVEKCESNSIIHRYHNVKNKNELISLLKGLSNNQQRLFPLIHFATHGNESGLKLIEDKISWGELCEPILNLNISSKNNLVLNMAACKGAFSIGLNNQNRAPYHFMFGPQNDINEQELENHLANFYKIYIDKPDLLEAFKYMKRENQNMKLPFQVHSCIFMFQKVWKLITKEIDKGSARHKLLKHAKEIVTSNDIENVKSDLMNKEQVIEFYKNNYSKLKNKFFLIDLYPELQSRFENIETEFIKKYLKKKDCD